MNINNLFIEKIKKFIYNDPKLAKIFTHHNVKYNIEDLLNPLLLILNKGITYRDVQQFTHIHWNTIYKFNVKLTKYNVLSNAFNETVNIYLDNLNITNCISYDNGAIISSII